MAVCRKRDLVHPTSVRDAAGYESGSSEPDGSDAVSGQELPTDSSDDEPAPRASASSAAPPAKRVRASRSRGI